MCHLAKKRDYLTVNQLIKINDSSINYSEENESTYMVEYEFKHFIIHTENIASLVMFINKFNIMLSFQNLKKFDIVYMVLVL